MYEYKKYEDYSGQGRKMTVLDGEIIYYLGDKWMNPENEASVRLTTCIERCSSLSIDPESFETGTTPTGRGFISHNGWSTRDRMGNHPFEAPEGVMIETWWYGKHHRMRLPAGRYQIMQGCIVAV